MGEVPGLEPGPTWGQGMSWPRALACTQATEPRLPASGPLLSALPTAISTSSREELGCPQNL